MMRFRPLAGAIRKFMGRSLPDITALATDRWEVSPATLVHIPPAMSLPGQAERIQGTEFATIEHVVRVLKGGYDVREAPTMAYRVADVDLADGVLFAPGAQRHLRPRRARSLSYTVPREAMRGAMYESWTGNRWFGTWLSDDCLSYRLAEAEDLPVATSLVEDWSHQPIYESLLGMAPRRLDAVHFDEVVVFDDLPNNAGKAARAADMRARLLSGRDLAPARGVFLLRGRTGARRVLVNERQIADRLATEYGFLILDPSTSSLDEIAAACGQARIIAGVEGSQLFHGLVMMPHDATVLIIQPPDRTVAIIKSMTDRQGQGFAFLVGNGGLDGFTAEWSEVAQTLDMILTS